VVFRANTAFAKPEIYEALEERGVKYAIRLGSDLGPLGEKTAPTAPKEADW
jgi:hypothetical protein